MSSTLLPEIKKNIEDLKENMQHMIDFYNKLAKLILLHYNK